MNFPNDETGQVLQEMHQAGIDLNTSHAVVFFHLFESKEQAQTMSNFIKEKFIDVSVSLHEDETPNVWDVDCTVNMIPDYDAILEKEKELEKVASTYSGYSDGWGIEA
jgi:intein-encoded DNA endonuclease-like protein|tara:strand:+ start:838 stop:1161 length:324 start_codon:yes stop_codon:yes gene_type:complete